MHVQSYKVYPDYTMNRLVKPVMYVIPIIDIIP